MQDARALASQHHIQLSGTFDTQVAHGLAALAEAGGSIAAPSTARIGLSTLLAKYGYSHNNKEEVHRMMKNDSRWAAWEPWQHSRVAAQ